MKIRYLLGLLFMGLIGIIGCTDDSESLIPSKIDEYKPQLSEGNASYDAKIQKWYKNTGVSILYKFEDREPYFNGSGEWGECFVDTIITSNTYIVDDKDVYIKNNKVYVKDANYPIGTTMNPDKNTWKLEVTVTGDTSVFVRKHRIIATENAFTVKPAEEEYVEKQLTWIEEMFLNCYPDSLLRRGLPLKMLLGRELTYSQSEYVKDQISKPYYYFFHNLIFNYGDESIDALTDKQKNEIKVDLHCWFIMERISSSFNFEEFHAASDFSWLIEGQTTVAQVPAYDACYGMGFVKRPTWLFLTVAYANDLEAYIRMVLGNSLEKMETKPVNGKYNNGNYYSSTLDYTGILHPDKDVNGKIRTKYNLLLKEFERLGIDLQRIGDLYN